MVCGALFGNGAYNATLPTKISNFGFYGNIDINAAVGADVNLVIGTNTDLNIDNHQYSNIKLACGWRITANGTQRTLTSENIWSIIDEEYQATVGQGGAKVSNNTSIRLINPGTHAPTTTSSGPATTQEQLDTRKTHYAKVKAAVTFDSNPPAAPTPVYSAPTSQE